MHNKFNGNGKTKKFKEEGPSQPIDFQGQKIKYPVTYQLKAIMDATRFDDDNKQDLTDVFRNLEIPYSYLDKKLSAKGTYVSFTYKVTLFSKEQMYRMYADLRALKSLKFAL